MLECGGAYTVENALDLEKTMNRLLSDSVEYNEACKAALDYTQQNRGATKTILDFIVKNRLIAD
jgi:3-deoxy-D-manno-octulosonic-acid transferase